MFIRVKSRPNTKKKSVQIVENKRKGDKVIQKVIQTVGYAFDDKTINHLKDVGEHLKAILQTKQQPNLLGSKKNSRNGHQGQKKKRRRATKRRSKKNKRRTTKHHRHT